MDPERTIMRALRMLTIAVGLGAALASGSGPAIAQEGAGATDEQAKAAELAKQLQNPIAALISMPFQSNADWGAGAGDDGFQYRLNIQPVIPITLNETWNLISRTILPVVYQDEVIVLPDEDDQAGLGDVVQSLFFSPQAPTAAGWIWGAGPVFLLPVATDDLLGAEKWGAGPTAVVLRQEKGWTYGALANHIWSFAGDDARADVNATFLQPFLGYTTPRQTTYLSKLEATHDWETSQWTAPVNLTVAQLVKVGKMPVQFELGGRYYLDAPPNGPEWGLRFKVTLLFPR